MADPVGALVSGLVEVILNRLGKPVFQEIGRVIGVKDELRRLNNTLSAIDAVLLDAEQQMTLHSVRNWLQDLKDVSFDIEDLLDLISTQDLKHKIRGTSFAQKVCEHFSRHSLARKLKAICSRLDEIAANRRDYNLQERQRPLIASVGSSSRERETYSFVQEARVFGREEDKELIVSNLLSSSNQESKQISVLPVVGIAGMGKTTLAKLVLSDPRVVENFDLKLWAYVPNQFDLKATIQNIVQSATCENSSHMNMEALKNMLHHLLANRTFLLVLDNMWIEDLNGWLELKELVDVGSKRSKLMVTTREERVASITGTMEAYKLKPLSSDHCWSIFVKCAFREGEEEAYPSLVQIGKDIVGKCCGVPLAAKSLGSQLRISRDDSTWRRIEESELWMIKQAPSDILPALKLSFDQLPYHIRPCFSLCSTFIKGELINRSEMILMWMSLGLLQSNEMNGDLEDIGNRYFDELLSRSFFEVVHPFIYSVQALAWCNDISEADMAVKLKWIDPTFSWEPSYNKIASVQMHDLVHHLAASVAANDTTYVSCNEHNVSTGVRYLVWKNEDLSERGFPYQLLAAKKARSLVFSHRKVSCLSKSFLQGVISNFKCLRILSLADFEFEELPNTIGDLKHLRYLSLARNPKLMGLPASVCKLVNLQALNVSLCDQLELLPKELHRLVSLRHLLFTSRIPTFPGIAFHGWTSMQRIMIADCLNLTSIPEQIGTLTTLRVLQIICCPRLTSLPKSICHLISLKELEIRDCEKLDLLGWEGLQGLRSIQHLDIEYLPLLVHFPEGFQYAGGSLKYLVIKDCENLVALPESLKHCSSLLKLTLNICPSLSSLPLGIQAVKSLQELWIADCPLLNLRCERGKGEDWHLISHIPRIQVDHCFI